MRLPINENTNIISHCLQVIADYWSKLHFRQGVLSLTHSFGVNR